MTTSGLGEELVDNKVNNQTAFYNDDPGSNWLESKNTLLLLIIIGLCVFIVLLLVIKLWIAYSKKASKSKENKSIRLFSKSTSVTGLNEGDKNDASIAKNVASVLNANDSVQLIKDVEIDQHKISGQKTAGMSIQLKNLGSSSTQFGTSTISANTLNTRLSAENLAQYLVHDLNDNCEKKEMSPCKIAQSSASGHNSKSSEKDHSLMPLDALGHPRAWFVPLNEICHEPIRHSYINMSNQNNFSSFNRDGKENFETKQPLLNDDELSGQPQFVVGSTECRQDWRDSGIPNSHSNLGGHNSNDFDKKPSLWEQREDRPVVFLGGSQHMSPSFVN